MVVTLLENITHEVLLVVFLLDHPHVQLHLSEERFPLALLPVRLRLRFTGWSLAKHQLCAVKIQPRCHFLVGEVWQVSALGAHSAHLFVEVERTQRHNFF
jgi:hypothetical protein